MGGSRQNTERTDASAHVVLCEMQVMSSIQIPRTLRNMLPLPQAVDVIVF